jgi:hypothetical protein
MTTRLRLHPSLLCAVVGAAVSFGVGSELPVWVAMPSPPPHPELSAVLAVVDLRNDYHPRKTLREAVTGTGRLAHDYPEKLIENGTLALLLLALGAYSGLLCWSVCECLRSARHPPTPGSDPAGR